MKSKKILAMALGCAMITASVMPAAFADPAPLAHINVAADVTAASLTGVGAFASSIYFNSSAAATIADYTSYSTIHTTALHAQSTSAATTNGGTDLLGTTDYLSVTSGNNTVASWDIDYSATNFDGTGTAYDFDLFTGVVDAAGDLTDLVQLYATTSVDFGSSTGLNCETPLEALVLPAGDIPVPATIKFTTTPTSLISFNPAGDAEVGAAVSDCTSITTKISTPVLDLFQKNGGFSANTDSTSTITFTLSSL